MELKIYDKANNLRLTASPNTSSSVTEEIGGECSVSASFTHTEYVPLDVDDYIELESVRYKVKSRYRPKQKNTQTYEYSVKFYAPIHDAEDTLMLFQEGGTTSEFSYDGGPREHPTNDVGPQDIFQTITGTPIYTTYNGSAEEMTELSVS